MTDVRLGMLEGLPFAAAGSGPPVAVLPGISGDPADAGGGGRRTNLRALRPLTERRTVYVINVKPGLPAGSSLDDVAGHYARALSHEFDRPVPVVGVSTGGSIAQCLAIDHPDQVERLVLLASACRLSPYGRRIEAGLARHARAGRPRQAWAATGPAMAGTTATGLLLAAFLWTAGASMTASDPTDLLTIIAAEDVFDAGADLYRIAAPTLVVGGGRDRFYGPDLFRETARGIPRARLALYLRKSHVGTIAHASAIHLIGEFLNSPAPETWLTQDHGR